MEASYFEGEVFENLSFVEESWQGLRFVDCQFQGCSFERCRLSHCSFSECWFSGCKILEPVCDQSEVRFLELDHCELTNVNWSLLLPFPLLFFRVLVLRLQNPRACVRPV